MPQRLDCLLQKEMGCLSPPECDVIHRAAVTQDAFTVNEEGVGRCQRLVAICDSMLRIDQDPREAPRFSSLCHHLSGFVSIRRDGEYHHLPVPALQQTDQIAIGPLRMRALRRPKIDDDNPAAIFTQLMRNALKIGQFKIGSRSI